MMAADLPRGTNLRTVRFGTPLLPMYPVQSVTYLPGCTSSVTRNGVLSNYSVNPGDVLMSGDGYTFAYNVTDVKNGRPTSVASALTGTMSFTYDDEDRML